MQVKITEPFATTVARMKEEKDKIMARHKDLLEKRYDLSDRPAKGVTMTRGKPIQEGVRAKTPLGYDLGKTGGHEAGGGQRKRGVARGIFAIAPSPIRKRVRWPNPGPDFRFHEANAGFCKPDTQPAPIR